MASCSYCGNSCCCHRREAFQHLEDADSLTVRLDGAYKLLNEATFDRLVSLYDEPLLEFYLFDATNQRDLKRLHLYLRDSMQERHGTLASLAFCEEACRPPVVYYMNPDSTAWTHIESELSLLREYTLLEKDIYSAGLNENWLCASCTGAYMGIHPEVNFRMVHESE